MSHPLDHLLDQLLGSLSLDGVSQPLTDWAQVRSESADGVTVITCSHPSGLEATITATRFSTGPAMEWTTTIHNTGETDSGVLEDLQPLHLDLEAGSSETVTLHTTQGSLCHVDDFLPWSRTVVTGDPVHLEPVGGRSSDGAMPFFSVATADRTLSVGIGWSGQWAADIIRTDTGCRIVAGLANANLRLHPGEQITLPSILVTLSDADPDTSSNALRAALERHYIPHLSEGMPATPLAHMTMSTFHVTKQVSEETELAAVRRAAEFGLEAFWVDACWYGETPMWAEQVGNWTVRTDAFPRGLRPISDAAHEAGMKFVLWIEPERARVGTRLVEERPDLFLTFPDDEQNVLLDLGNQEARETIVDMISSHLTDFNVDIYRQDFNIRPLPAWQHADQPDRQGMHEIRHVEGLYWLWDELLRRHPGLVIDNCASGGRRIDVETMRRSVPLWRSDAADVGGGAIGDGVTLANQTQVSGLSKYVAQHTGPIWAFDPYHIRSAISTGFVVYCPLPEDPDRAAQLTAAVQEIKRVRPQLQGDFHSLLTPTMDQGAWSASQFHRADAGTGLAVILRRPNSDSKRQSIALRGLDPAARYTVTRSVDYAAGDVFEASGQQLATMDIDIPLAPGSVLVEYERTD